MNRFGFSSYVSCPPAVYWSRPKNTGDNSDAIVFRVPCWPYSQYKNLPIRRMTKFGVLTIEQNPYRRDFPVKSEILYHFRRWNNLQYFVCLGVAQDIFLIYDDFKPIGFPYQGTENFMDYYRIRDLYRCKTKYTLIQFLMIHIWYLLSNPWNKLNDSSS